MSNLPVFTTCFSNNTIASREITAKTVTTTQQESPDSQNFALGANGQTIPSDTPIVVLTTASDNYDNLILAPPPNQSVHARLAIVNASGYPQAFDSSSATSNVANSGISEVMVDKATSQFVWNPNTSLWYQLEMLDA